MKPYSSAACDLCGSAEHRQLFAGRNVVGMCSDTRIARRALRKAVCTRCGLVREGQDFSYADLDVHYSKEYQLNTGHASDDHMFFRDGQPVPRSAAVAEWMVTALERAGGAPVSTIFEVGAGQGNLLMRLRAHFPEAALAGCEVSEAAAERAREKGLPVVTGDDSAIEGKYDLIVAYCVLEHVPSPSEFLARLSRHLTERGQLLVAQPMQDVESYDVYFVDHLHHFHTRHVEMLANAGGLAQVYVDASPWYAPNISLHLLRNDPAAKPAIEFVAPHAIERTVKQWDAIFDRSRRLAETSAGKRYAIFGLNEVAGLMHCYGALDTMNIVVALDDFPERYAGNHFELPVRRLEELSADEKGAIDGVVLTLNAVYHDRVAERCRAQGLQVINLFEQEPHELAAVHG